MKLKIGDVVKTRKRYHYDNKLGKKFIGKVVRIDFSEHYICRDKEYRGWFSEKDLKKANKQERFIYKMGIEYDRQNNKER